MPHLGGGRGAHQESGHLHGFRDSLEVGGERNAAAF